MEEYDVKGKQWIQDKEVLLYKPYKVNLSKLKTPELTLIQDKIETSRNTWNSCKHQYRPLNSIHHLITNPCNHKENKTNNTGKK